MAVGLRQRQCPGIEGSVPVLLGVLLLTASSAYSGIQWPAGGVRTAPLSTANVNLSLCDDERGGTFIAWTDSFGGKQKVFVQRLGIIGNRLWGEDGIQVTTDTGNQNGIRIVPDGRGGALAAWNDARLAGSQRVFVQRFNRHGSAKWSRLGVALSSQAGYLQHLSRPVHDSVLFSYGPHAAPGDLWVQRLDLAANRLLGSQGRRLVGRAAPNGGPIVEAIADDGSGGLYLGLTTLYSEGRPPHYFDYDIAAWFRHVAPDASSAFDRHFWGTSCSHLSFNNVQVAHDRTGSAFVAWRGSAYSTWFLVSRLVRDTWTWPEYEAASSWGSVLLVPDDRGAVFVLAVRDGIPYIQRCEATGRQWGETGIPLDTAVGSFALAADDSAGALATYTDTRSRVLRTKWLRADGTPAWVGVIDSLSDSLGTPRIVNDRNGACVVVWPGRRNGQWALYAQRFGFRYPVQDAGVLAILGPADTVAPGTVLQPRALVRNYSNALVSVPVILGIGDEYRDTTALTLPPGATDTAGFRDWTPGAIGTSTIMCGTALAGDSNPANDFRFDTTTVARIDIAVVAIVAPAESTHTGDTIRPVVTIRNLGTHPASPDVTLRIDTTWQQTLNVPGLSPDSTASVMFRPWTAGWGDYPIVCSTRLARDCNPANDRLEQTFRARYPYDLNAAALEVVAPGPKVDTGTPFVPQVRLANHGNLISDIPARLRIGSFYLDSQVVRLAPTVESTMAFRPCEVLPRGQNLVVCSTKLAGDAWRSDDVAKSTVRPRVKDLRMVMLVAPPESILSDDWVTPRAKLANDGTDCESVTVTCRIESVYCAAIDPGCIEPQRTLTVSFPAWYALPGTWTVTCSTRLAGDAYPDNDRFTETLRVTARPALSIRNYPNPFRDETRFVFGIPRTSQVRLSLYDITGTLISRLVDGQQYPPGIHSLTWSTAGGSTRFPASGIYHYTLEVVEFWSRAARRVTGKLVIR